jgi:hypothetical protein
MKIMPEAGSPSALHKAGAGDRYAALTAAIVRRLRLGAGPGRRAEPAGALGVNYQLARVAAGLCEAAYMYLAMRWLVFRDVRASVTSRP